MDEKKNNTFLVNLYLMPVSVISDTILLKSYYVSIDGASDLSDQ